jgi:hypothetical protein
LVASWFLGEERSGKCEDADEEERRMATFSCEILGLVAVSRIEVLTGESEDVDEEEGRATTFSSEVLGLVVLSRFDVLSKECEDVDEGRRRSRGRSLVSWRFLGLGVLD